MEKCENREGIGDSWADSTVGTGFTRRWPRSRALTMLPREHGLVSTCFLRCLRDYFAASRKNVAISNKPVECVDVFRKADSVQSIRNRGIGSRWLRSVADGRGRVENTTGTVGNRVASRWGGRQNVSCPSPQRCDDSELLSRTHSPVYQRRSWSRPKVQCLID